MKIEFNAFVKKEQEVYLLKDNRYKDHIMRTMDYAKCAFGVHPNKRIQVMPSGSTSFVLSVSDMEALSKLYKKTVGELISQGKAAKFTHELNSQRIYNYKIVSEKTKNNREKREKRKEVFRDELSKGVKRPLPKSQWIERTRIELKDKSTNFERLVYDKLPRRIKRRAVVQYPVKAQGKIYFIDIYIKRWKVALEVDGGYHNTIEQQEKDAQRDADLWTRGIRTIRIPNDIVNTPELGNYLKQIEVKRRDLDENGNIKTIES